MLNSAISKQFLVVAVLLFFVKLIALYKEVYIGKIFGFSSTLDAYYISYALAAYFPTVILATFSTLLVPLFISYKESSQLSSMLSFLMLLTISVCSLNGVLIYLFSGNISEAYQSNSSMSQSLEIKQFLEHFSILPPLLVATGIFVSFIIANKNNLSFIFEVIPNFILIATLTLLYKYLGNFSLSLGVILGSVSQFFIIYAYTALKYGIKLSFDIDRASIMPFFSLGSGAILLIFVQMVSSPIYSIDNYLALDFGTGSVASYNYAIKFIAIGISLLSVIIIRVILPDFAELQNQNKYELLNSKLNNYIFGFVVITMSACLAATQFIEQLINLIFSDENFSSKSIADIVKLTKFGLFQIPFVAANLLIVQIFAVKKLYTVIAVVTATSAFVKFFSNLLLAKFFGLNGIMLAWAAMYFWSFFCFYALYKLKFVNMKSRF